MTTSLPGLGDQIEQFYSKERLALEQTAELVRSNHGVVLSTSSLEQTLCRLGPQNNARSDDRTRVDHQLCKREAMTGSSALAVRSSNVSEKELERQICRNVSTLQQAQHKIDVTPKDPCALCIFNPEHIPSPASTVRAECETDMGLEAKPLIAYHAVLVGNEHLLVPQFPSEDQVPQELEAIESIFWGKDLAISSMLPPWWWWPSVPSTWQPYQARYTQMARHIAFYSSKSPSQMWTDPALAISVDFFIAAYRNRTHELQTLFTNYSTLSNPFVLNAALLLASRTNCIEAANMLLSFGASPSGQDVSGVTPLHVATEKNFPLLLWTLLSTGANVNCKTKSGDTPWTLISGSPHHDQIAKLLLSAGAQCDVCVYNGIDLNNYAAMDCDIKYSFHKVIVNLHGEHSIDTVRIMLERGMNPNIRTCEGRYPLDIAVSAAQIDVVKLLVNFGADVNCGLERGRTPLDITYHGWRINMPEIQQFLIEHGAARGEDVDDDRTDETSGDFL